MQRTKISSPGRRRPAIALRLAIAYVAVFFWMGAYLPYWPVWLAHRGMTPSEVGILLGVVPWMRVVASPLAGRWADRHGRPDRLATVLSIAWVIAMTGFAWASGFGELLLIMIAVGLVHAPFIPLVDGLTIAAEAEGRVRYGPVRLWGSASFIAASWVGGELLELLGEAIVLWILVGAAAATAASSAWLPSIGTGDRATEAKASSQSEAATPPKRSARPETLTEAEPEAEPSVREPAIHKPPTSKPFSTHT